MQASATISADPPRQRPLLALAIRLLSAVCLAVMFALIKLASERDVPLIQMLAIRQVMTIPLLIGWLAATGALGCLRTSRLRSHFTRATTGSFGMVLNFAAPTLLPLAVAATLGFTAPIFAVLLSFFLLREQVGRWRLTAAMLGLIGVAIVADPFGAELPPIGIAVGLGAAFMVALISVQVRDLARTEAPIAIVTWFAIFSSPVMLVASLFTTWSFAPIDMALLLAIGVVGTMGQICLTYSLQLGSVASVVVMDYSALLWSTLLGSFVFAALPPATLWLGAPLIIAAGIIIVWREQVKARQRPDAPFV